MTNMDFIKEFTIPFYKIQIDNWYTKKQKLLEICNSSKLNYADNEDSKVYTTYKSGNNFAEPVLKILQDDLNKFSEEVGPKYSLMNAWFQRYVEGNYHGPHNHGDGGYSSVCFIEYDENEHNPPTFICPFKSVEGSTIEYTPKNVVEGTIIFFPSMIFHYVLPTTSDKIRTIMSMNIVLSN